MWPQDLTDAAGRKAAADLLDVLLRAPETFRCGASDDRLNTALAELAKKVLLDPLESSAAHLQRYFCRHHNNVNYNAVL